MAKTFDFNFSLCFSLLSCCQIHSHLIYNSLKAFFFFFSLLLNCKKYIKKKKKEAHVILARACVRSEGARINALTLRHKVLVQRGR